MSLTCVSLLAVCAVFVSAERVPQAGVHAVRRPSRHDHECHLQRLLGRQESVISCCCCTHDVFLLLGVVFQMKYAYSVAALKITKTNFAVQKVDFSASGSASVRALSF